MVSLSSILVLEITLGVLLIARWRLRLTLGIVIGTLVVFSVALVTLIVDESAPSCGCTGAIRLATEARANNILGFGRNFLLVAACVWLRGRAASKPFFP